MVHCQALPGTLHYHGDIERIIRLAVEDARELEAGGVDGICVENGNDSPTGERLEAAQIAALGVVAAKVREQVQIPLGIDAAFNDCRAAFAVAVASGAESVSYTHLDVYKRQIQMKGVLVANRQEREKIRELI